jgi:uncharacterized protein
VSASQSLLRINVGFIVHQSNGFSRDFPIEIPSFLFSEDLEFENLIGNALVSRTTEGLLVQFRGQAQTKTDCVLCLEPFDQRLKLDFVEMYTFLSHANQDTELILPDDLHIDLHPLIGEYLCLEIPISPVCKPDCKGLCPICGENLNWTACNHQDEIADSRLAILKTLLDDDASAV